MTNSLSNLQAVLNELKNAMKDFREQGNTYTLYVEKTGLSESEQIELLETLGKGNITIRFDETDQPVEWFESEFSGIWIGIYKNGRDDAIVHTIEVGRYPAVAGAFDEDIIEAEEELQKYIDAADL